MRQIQSHQQHPFRIQFLGSASDLFERGRLWGTMELYKIEKPKQSLSEMTSGVHVEEHEIIQI